MKSQFFVLVLTMALLPLRSSQAGPAWALPLEARIRSEVAALTSFTVDLPSPEAEVTVSAGDFGLLPGKGPRENVLALQSAIDHCKANGVSRLVLPPGRYRMGTLKAPGGEQITKASGYTHHTGRVYQVKLIGLRDFTLDGQGAELIFRELRDIPEAKKRLGGYFVVKDCRRVRITNLALDWDWEDYPLAFYGKVVNVDEENLTVDYELEGGPFPRQMTVYMMREWDRTAGCRDPGVFHFAMGYVMDHGFVSENVLRFRMKRKSILKGAKLGDWGIFKTRTRYAPQAFTLDLNEHLSLDDVRVYGVPENAVWARQNRFLQIRNCQITPRPGTTPVWSSHGGFEIHNHFGYFRMENCELSYVFDDALHFSDFFLAGNIERLDDHTLQVGGLMYFQSADTFMNGSRLEFRRANFEPLGFSAEIADHEWTLVTGKGQAKHYVTVTTRETLPERIEPDTLLFNTTYGVGRYVIRNNRIRTGLCHGLYVCMPNGLIEDNEIVGTAYPALVVHSLLRWGRWPMGHPPANVIVRNNTIRNCNTALRRPADLFVGGGYDPQGGVYRPVDYPVAQNVIVENNTIEGSPWQGIAAWSCRNVLITGNQLRNTNRLPSPKGQDGSIFVRDAEKVHISGNERRLGAGFTPNDAGISIDAGSTRDVAKDRNSGFGAPHAAPR
ncbi:MAG: hypothetical protein HN742_21690 [Lentisphaerae bacterium]|jgi:hypothetical protein|nr:hypothetical protein [Lentisphaerota bacterium]MBT5608348.1 hypothetical protein [Lentisphaerota bacterium]MBT7061660.1 hypothetical protein [Lentisphaerota bacterium]MBT7844505.1 hypothetical protein [Lentisphaerota bacterium]